MDTSDFESTKQELEIKAQKAEYGFFEFFRSMPKWWKITAVASLVLAIPMYFIFEYATSFFYLRSLAAGSPIVHTNQYVQLPVKVEKVEAVRISGNSYAAYAQIKNQNGGLSSPDLSYTFHFMDSAGTEIGNVNGTDFILGGEEKFLVAPHVDLSQAPSKVTIEINPDTWQSRTDIPTVILNDNLPTYDDVQTGGTEVKGTVQNQSIYTLNAVLVNGFAYNSKGEVVAVMQTIFNTQAPQENRGYKLYWPNSISAEISSVKVYSETNLLDSTNLQ
jgi:hypothetical protein